jgi:hypothetical protein
LTKISGFPMWTRQQCEWHSILLWWNYNSTGMIPFLLFLTPCKHQSLPTPRKILLWCQRSRPMLCP